MKVLFCLPVYMIFEERCSTLAKVLVEQGHEVYCAVQRGPAEGDYPTIECAWGAFELDPIIDIDPDLIIMWNGHFNDIHAAYIWLKRRYKLAIMEMGWYQRSHHSYLLEDLAQASSLAEVPYEEGVASQDRYQEVLQDVRGKYDTNLPAGLEIPKAFIFMPMQLEYDTQIVHTSPIFKTMASAIGYVQRCVPGAPVIVRNHPLDEFISRPHGVIDMTSCSPSLPLALASTLVVGINSTVLAEAMLFRRPVVALGAHVAKKAFTSAVHMGPTYLSLRDGYISNNFMDICDYRSLVLNHNQWPTQDVPGWLIDKIEHFDFSPRIPT